MVYSFEHYYMNVKKLLKNFGYRDSLRRERILKILFDTKEFISAVEIKEMLRVKYEIVISLSMVYKHIAILKSLQLVEHIKEENKNEKYKINAFSKKDYIICLKCDKVIEVDSKIFNDMLKNIVEKNKFTLLEHNLKMYGYCKECRDVRDKS